MFRPALQFALSGIVPTVSGDLVFTTLKWPARVRMIRRQELTNQQHENENANAQLRLRPSLALKQREAMSCDRSAWNEINKNKLRITIASHRRKHLNEH